jgi:hypothetical protein
MGGRTFPATAAREERPPGGPIVRPLRHFATSAARRGGAPTLQNAPQSTAPRRSGRRRSSASVPLQGGAPGTRGASATMLPAAGATGPPAPAARAPMVKRPASKIKSAPRRTPRPAGPSAHRFPT